MATAIDPNESPKPPDDPDRPSTSKADKESDEEMEIASPESKSLYESLTRGFIPRTWPGWAKLLIQVNYNTISNMCFVNLPLNINVITIFAHPFVYSHSK
jgi:hypothetical protein